jgi:DNA polymerase-3 subunit delta
MSLFAAKRIVEIRLPTGKAGTAGTATLTRLAQSPAPDVLLLVLCGWLDAPTRNGAWVQAFERHGAVLPMFSPANLAAWLRERAASLGLRAEPAALELLVERVEGNLLAADQELRRLQLLLPDANLTQEVVRSGVADSARFDVSQLAEALDARDAARALRVLFALRSEGVALPLVLWCVNAALRRAWARRSAALSFDRLTAQAGRADRMAKGQLPGDGWLETALLVSSLCGKAALAALPVMK